MLFESTRQGTGAAAQRTSMISVFYQLVDTANPPWPTSVAPRRAFPGRAARGSVVLRKMACRPAGGGKFHSRFKAVGSRTGKGQPRRCPFLTETKMDALILKRASASSGKAADVIEALHLTRIAHNLDCPFRQARRIAVAIFGKVND